jgi:hypothetical protein
MSRFATHLLLLMALVWQPLAFAEAARVQGADAKMAHLVLHWMDEAHHHHGDGEVHAEESAEGLSHVQGDHAHGGCALPSATTAAPLMQSGLERLRWHALEPPQPVLAGLLRPPRSLD